MNKYLFIICIELYGENIDFVATFEGEDLSDPELRDNVCTWLSFQHGMGDTLAGSSWRENVSDLDLSVYKISEGDPIHPISFIEETRERILAVINKNKEEDEIRDKEKRKEEFEKLKKEFGD